ncbi:hypothetical protein FGG08_004144 [Glutinoglossum americanum]|uniref:Uncharacterized protein n=1 Tax=Glutinoglossum americanum TaxID=1670608 RepID=A0A9P8I858_9PEZI|nr:hypothetical protein FGG08_004144 [Glutinoglossum americanum]
MRKLITGLSRRASRLWENSGTPAPNHEGLSVSAYLPKMLPTDRLDSIVAVHGLGGHAMNTWTHKSSKKMWLRDFLPETMPDARIMTFGYDARVLNSRNILGLLENAENLLADLWSHRSSADV